MKNARNYRVHLGFMQAPDTEVNEYALSVIEGMKSNPAFPNPPVPLVPGGTARADGVTDLTTRQQGFSSARVAAANGGTQLTADKNQKRELVTDALHQLAMYVQASARHDLAKLLASGFEAASTNRASLPLDKPAIAGLFNESSGELLLRGTPVVNARSYQVQISSDGGKTWKDLDASTGSRRISLAPVTPGVTYTVRFRAVGGIKKYSDWSDPVSHMAT
jgi:hypothetical protein